MKSPYESILAEAERELLRHWTILAGIACGLVLVGFLAIVVTGNGWYPDGVNQLDGMSFYDINGIGAMVAQFQFSQ